MAAVGGRGPSTAAPLAGDAELSLGEIPAEDVLATLHHGDTQSDVQEGDESDGEADGSDAAWRLARPTGRLYGALYGDEDGSAEEDGDDDDNDDDDDDIVQRSWSAENTSLEAVDRSATHDDDDDDEVGHEEDDEDDEDDEEELLALQFRSELAVQWSTVESAASTQESSDRVEESVRAALSILNRHGGRGRHDDGGGDSDGEVQRKLDGDEGEENDSHANDWAVDYGADGKPYYYDIVHEAMEARWPQTAEQLTDATGEAAGDAVGSDGEHDAEDTHSSHGGRGTSAAQYESDNQSDRDDKHECEAEHTRYNENHGDEDQSDEEADAGGDDVAAQSLQLHASRASDSHPTQQQNFQRSNFTLSNFSTLTDGGDDEWQEAYTAKGRVYYYNRRTRESSWKRPDNYVSRQAPQTQLGFASSFSSSRGIDSGHHQSGSFYSSSASVGRATASAALGSSESQDFLFCSFCGRKTVGADAALRHVRECSAHRYHRDNRTDVHRHFEQLLGLLAEDATLRSLHYASSFPEATPMAISPVALATYRDHASASASSPRRRPQAAVHDSLFLLRRHRRSTTRRMSQDVEGDDVHHQDVGVTQRDERAASTRRVLLDRKSSTASARSTDSAASSRRRKTSAGSVSEAASSRSGASSSLASRQRQGSGQYQESETCRYCGRSFAEGRLAKHEAVCPRVFGSEGSWGRGVLQPPPTTPRASASPFAKSAAATSRRKPKPAALEKRNLALSFKEHQATLVSCPVCERKFAPSGAQQHIDICKSVQNRPRNPIRATNFAVAG